MFRAYLGPSSGGTTIYIQQLVLIILFRRLSVVLVRLEFQYIPLYLLMMGLDTPEISTCWPNIGGGVDKSLARPTLWCRTESLVSLERGDCSRAELQVFSCYRGWKEACQAKRAISTTWRRKLWLSFFFLQGKAQKEIHAILTETLGEHAPSYTAVKIWLA